MSGPSLFAKEYIQDAIMDAALAADYYRVVYEQGSVTRRDPVTVPPRTVKCNEIDSDFAPDANHGKGYQLYRAKWQFALVMVFDKEVTIEAFIDNICQNPLKVTNSDGKFVGMAELTKYHASHPVTNSSAPGSQFTLLFSVNKFRK